MNPSMVRIGEQHADKSCRYLAKLGRAKGYEPVWVIER